MTRPEKSRWLSAALVASLGCLQAACATAPVAAEKAASAALLAPPDPATISVAVLPAGDQRSLVVRTCAVCHAIELVVLRKRTADEWDRQIAKMVGYGAKASDEEQEQIFQYLVTHFRTDTSATATDPSSH
jgi:cytochrome c5